MQKLRFVIVDDEYKIGSLIKRLLHAEELGLECLGVFDDSEKALSFILGNDLDLVITDIKMPVLDGIGLISRIRPVKDKLRFILISGYRDFEYAHSAIKYGVEDYLLKPINEEELNHAVQKLVEETRRQNSVEEEAAESSFRKQLLSGQTIADLLSSGRKPDWQTINQSYHTSFLPGRSMAFLLVLDESTGKEIPQGKLLINNLLPELDSKASALAGERAYGFRSPTELLGVLNGITASESELMRSFQDIFSEARQYVLSIAGLELTIAMGDILPLEELGASFSRASFRISQRLLLGTDRVIGPATPVLAEEESRAMDNSSHSRMVSAVEKLSTDEILGLWSELYAQLCASSNAQTVYSSAELFVENVFSLIPKSTKSMEDLQQIKDLIARSHTLEGLDRVVREKLAEQFVQLSEERDKRLGLPVREAMRYIAEHYQEGITANQLSDMLRINPSYFSVLFKKETGKNFVDYITDYRLDKAKELLVTTNCTMASVASQVGYSDTRYFSQIFTKRVGIKPSQYRKLYS